MSFPRISLALSVLACAVLHPSSLLAQGTERASVDSAGAESYFSPFDDPAISADGNFVAFSSNDFGLVPGDTNGVSDIFVRDRAAGLTTRVSVDTAGFEGNNTSFRPDISGDGRYVTYASYATNLVVGDSNGLADIFLHDRLTGITSRISVDSFGTEANSASEKAEISADGTTVAFFSFATNLVAGDTNGAFDCFVHEIATGLTTRVSISSGGVEANAMCGSFFPDISADGRFVTFDSYADNLVLGDTNGYWDIFVHDRMTGLTTRASVSTAGVQGNGDSISPSISDDGNQVAFFSFASDLVAGDTNVAQDCFVHDRTTGVTTRVSVDSGGIEGEYDSSAAVISGDGTVVAFISPSTNLVAGDTNAALDVFVHEISSGITTRASLTNGGAQANSSSNSPDISADGKMVAFTSSATNLVTGDTNGLSDVFVRDRNPGPPGPILTVSGACGGFMDFDVTGATPGGSLALFSGPPGVFVKPGPPCLGLTLDISPPTLRILLIADAAGTASLAGVFVPAAACGLGVQVVDITACMPTGMVVL